MPPQPDPPKWHPLQSVREPEPAHWELWDNLGRKYGDVTLVKRDGSLGYRTLVLRPHATAPADLGLAPSLRQAVEAIQRSWVAGHVSAEQGHTVYPGYGKRS